MEEKPIKIIVENYNNKRFTFTMSQDANLSIQTEISCDTMHHNNFYNNLFRITGFTIEASDGGGIEVKREEIV